MEEEKELNRLDDEQLEDVNGGFTVLESPVGFLYFCAKCVKNFEHCLICPECGTKLVKQLVRLGKRVK